MIGYDRFTLYVGTQRPHTVRADMAQPHPAHYGNAASRRRRRGRRQLRHEGRALSRICAGAVGLAQDSGRPVKWIAERGEGMLTDDHDRDHVSEAELALDRDGRFLALRARNISNIGAYLAPGGIISPTMHLGGLAGTYTTPAIYVEVSAVFTNTTSIGPYRGVGTARGLLHRRAADRQGGARDADRPSRVAPP